MRSDKWMFAVVIGGVLGLTLVFPHVALAAYGAAPWESALQTVVDFMTGSTAHLLAIMAVAGVGVAMLAGHMDIRSALSVIVGIAVIFGAATIVGLFGR